MVRPISSHHTPDAKSILSAVTASSAIAAVVTVSVGRAAPLRKSALVIFFVVAAEASTIAISSAASGTVSAGNWLILGMALSSLSYYGCI